MTTTPSAPWFEMPFLSRVHLDPARREARRLMGSPQVMHAVLSAAAAGADLAGDEPTGRLLWRLDRAAADGEASLYIVSPTPPDLSSMVSATKPDVLGWMTRDYNPLLARLLKGQRWAFRATVNPVRQVRTPDGGRGEVKAHVTAAQQVEWFLHQGAAAGFEVARSPSGDPAVQLTERRTLTFRRQQATVTLAAARLDGVLEVTDAAALRAALVNGVGRGKAYGCGLVTLMPLLTQP